MIADNSSYLYQSLLTNKVGAKNYFISFTKDQERQADYYAIKTLDKLKLDKGPLIKLLNLLEEKSIQIGNNEEYQKFSTHPIFKERYEIIDNSQKHEKYNFNQNLNKRFYFIRSKLFGYSSDNIDSLNKYLEGDFLNYSKSIILARKGKIKQSMKLINHLINKYPDNIFLLEVKADLIYSNGYTNQALLFYEEIIKKYPMNNYISIKIFNIKFSMLKIMIRINQKNYLIIILFYLIIFIIIEN